MRHISPTRTALAVGMVIGLWHLCWVTLVGVGWAKPALDFILRLHFLNISYALAPFALSTAVSLVILTFAIGAVFGFLFALVWNWMTFESAPEWARDTHSRSSLNQPG